MTSEPLVSVVTPVYNEEAYLPECIESVLGQTYRNWNYTIVNNCSTDRSLEIAQQYAAKDSRIRVYDNERFLEMLPNHNVAVRQISEDSKYCKVLLGDDFMYADCLERMVAVAEANPTVGVVSAYERCGDQIRLTGLPEGQQFVAGREACRQFLLGALLLFGSQTSVLYRADLVRKRDPFYLEEDRFADFEACFALLRATDLGFAHQVLTFSRPRPQSMGAISADIGCHFRSSLNLLFTYGHDCLTSREFDECLERHLSECYRFLGRRLWVDQDQQFWAYHKRTLVEAGVGFDRARLARAAIRELFGLLMSPKSTAASVKRLLSLRHIRGRHMRGIVLDSAEASSPAGAPGVRNAE